MELSLKLQHFEGPMDLLLHLIEKNKVSIYDIPIAMITDQYMEYLESMDRNVLDDMSEFLVMAATLLDIKAKMLLPAEKDEDGEEIDPRDELVARLLEYKMYKYMSLQLKDREDEAGKKLFRQQQLPEEVIRFRPPVDTEQLLEDVTILKLGAVFAEVIRRQEERVDPVRSQFGRIEKEQVDTKKVMTSVTRRIMRKNRCTFRSLLEHREGKMYAVITFLTVLELVRQGKVLVQQDGLFGEIYINAAKGVNADSAAEVLEVDGYE